MLRIRVCASFLSILSVAIAAWAWVGRAAGGVFIALLIAAACLAIILPFDAPDPPRRTRVVVGCFAYMSALTVAIIFAKNADSSALLKALFLLAQLGAGLTCWALATRNRRRASGLRRYYDN